MATNTVYLISGANRGIGFGLVSDLIKRNNVVVFAGTRNPEQALELKQLQAKHKNLHIVKLASTNVEEAKLVAKEIEQTAGRVDVVIANAGIANSYANPAEEDLDAIREHFEVNTLGPLVLYQATRYLLKQSAEPKFIVISTVIASIAMQEKLPFPGVAYGTSKAAVNYVTKRIHIENDGTNFTAFVIHPGWVQTDMGDGAAKSLGLEKADITLQQSVDGLINVFDKSSRENSGGRFLSYNGSELEW